ncbi:hypothetical protein A3K89_17415 [Rhodococcoides kyotonense]|uniref:HTH tetR-type domain-containing protein n=1 Tax=Rhodococcoides kyotonense TaxID=398843 RepID=A0A177YL10_9NOCA|nr:hypothetical protein A3K89_17415 [Rhodococcus kyotonensis]
MRQMAVFLAMGDGMPAVSDAPSPDRRRGHAEATRTSIFDAAAREFARHGYVAASINAILAECGYTKGGFYFHFASKVDLAHAVVDAATARYAAIAEQWQSAPGDPLDVLAELVDALAAAFVSDRMLRAEVHLSITPDLHCQGADTGGRAWEAAALDLVERAQTLGHLDRGVDACAMVRALATMLAGYRYLAEPDVDLGTLRDRFSESVRVVVSAKSATNTDWRRPDCVDAALEVVECDESVL